MAMWSPYQKYPATIQAVLANGMLYALILFFL